MSFKMYSATGSGPLLHPCASLRELRLQKIIVFPDLTYCCCTSPGLSVFAISSLPSVVKLSLVVWKDTNPQTCTFSWGGAPCAGHCMKISLMNMRISLVIDEHENIIDIISHNLTCHALHETACCYHTHVWGWYTMSPIQSCKGMLHSNNAVADRYVSLPHKFV